MVAARVYRVTTYDVQDDFIFDDRRYVAFVGGRNSGKTYAGSIKAMACARNGGLGVIAAPDFPMLEHGAKRQFIERLTEAGVRYFLNNQKGVLTIPAWNAEILFATLETESRVRGPNFAWGWVDEVEYLTDRNIWKALKGAIRAGDKPQLFATSTPKGRRLIYNEWVVTGGDDHALYRATTHDNPFIDADDYISGLGYSGVFFDQEINAEFVTFEGLVYPKFDRDRNIGAPDVEGWRTVLAVDVGTRNPTAILVIRAGADVERHVESEVYRRGMSSDEITEAVAAAADRHNPERIWLDPSAASYILSLSKLGYPVEKANNDISYGIGIVTTAIAEGMTIDPSCINLIAELESYRYPDGKIETDKPVKENDHAADALRYGLAGLENRPVDYSGQWVF